MTKGLFDLTGKVGLVTGGNGGIGLGYARALARQGADTVIWGRNAKKNEAALAELSAFGHRVSAVEIDVSNEEAVAAAMKDAVTQYGRLDCVVVNAGIVTFAKSVFEIDGAAFRKLLDTNLNGAFYTLREAARHMVDQSKAGRGGGSLIVCGSLSVFVGHRGLEHYGAAKGALNSIVKSMAAELGRYGIRVNMIAPGFIDTEGRDDASTDPVIAKRTPLGRVGRPVDCEGACAYLASDAAAFHTGDILTVDGGWMASLF